MLRTLSETARISQGLSLSRRGAGAQPGDWELQMVESGDVEDDGWLTLADLKEITIARNARTERHLLRPYDVLLTARTGSSHAALVPPEVSPNDGRRDAAGGAATRGGAGYGPLVVVLPHIR